MSELTYTAEIDGQLVTKGTNSDTVYRWAAAQGMRVSVVRSQHEREVRNAQRSLAMFADAGFELDEAEQRRLNNYINKHQKALAAIAHLGDNEVLWNKASFHSDNELARQAAARVRHTLVRVVPVTCTKNYSGESNAFCTHS